MHLYSSLPETDYKLYLIHLCKLIFPMYVDATKTNKKNYLNHHWNYIDIVTSHPQ